MRARAGRILSEGAIAGLLGAAGVAAVLAVWSLATGHGALYVPWALGSAITGDPTTGPVSTGPAMWYGALHVTAAVAIGIIAAFFIARTEARHVLWFFLGYVLVVGLLYSVMLFGAYAVEAAGLISWPAVVLANTTGALLTGGYLWRLHRKLFRTIAAEGVDAGLE